MDKTITPASSVSPSEIVNRTQPEENNHVTHAASSLRRQAPFLTPEFPRMPQSAVIRGTMPVIAPRANVTSASSLPIDLPAAIEVQRQDAHARLEAFCTEIQIDPQTHKEIDAYLDQKGEGHIPSATVRQLLKCLKSIGESIQTALPFGRFNMAVRGNELLPRTRGQQSANITSNDKIDGETTIAKRHLMHVGALLNEMLCQPEDSALDKYLKQTAITVLLGGGTCSHYVDLALLKVHHRLPKELPELQLGKSLHALMAGGPKLDGKQRNHVICRFQLQEGFGPKREIYFDPYNDKCSPVLQDDAKHETGPFGPVFAYSFGYTNTLGIGQGHQEKIADFIDQAAALLQDAVEDPSHLQVLEDYAKVIGQQHIDSDNENVFFRGDLDPVREGVIFPQSRRASTVSVLDHPLAQFMANRSATI